MTVASPAIPRQLGEFHLEEKIGQGGICEVYRAHQPSLDRRVAVKLLRQHHMADLDLRRRFVREARILARLSHPNIIHIIDAGSEGDWVYYIMEYVEGTDYKEILCESKLSLTEKLDIVIQTLKGLEYAHDNGVIHRDLKPANIMVDQTGNARLADFGIAHLFTGAGEIEATQTGDLMGTPAYMAPEQRTSAKNVDKRSDIFSVGVILYETVTGRKPVGRVRPPSELNPEAPPAIDEVILKCLEHNPADRFASAAELKDCLRVAMGRSSDPTPKPEPAFGSVDSFIGRCKFLDTLKETNSSVSYLVKNTADSQLYVIKKIIGRNIELGYMRRLVVLKHPHILNIYGAGSDLKKTVVVTDYARGGALADRLGRRWSEEEVIRFLHDAASALDFAHKNDIVHGNLRPENVLFSDKGRVLLADFGLAPAPGKRKSWWRAPENQVSHKADLFSLGALAYRMLYGDRPRWFSENNLHFPRVQNFVSREIRWLLTRLLYQDPKQRCMSAEEIVLQLKPPSEQTAVAGGIRVKKPKTTIPVWVWVLVSIIAILIGTVLALWKVP